LAAEKGTHRWFWQQIGMAHEYQRKKSDQQNTAHVCEVTTQTLHVSKSPLQMNVEWQIALELV